MGGRASRQKGNRAERAIVHLLQDRGFAAERVPLSGAARGRFGGDVSVPLLGIDRRVEVKCRGNGFNRLYDWLNGADFLIVRADRASPWWSFRYVLQSRSHVRRNGRSNHERPLRSPGDQDLQKRRSRRPARSICGASNNGAG